MSFPARSRSPRPRDRADLPIPVGAPPRVRDLVRGTPDGPVPVVHAGPHAVYVALGSGSSRRCVGVLGRQAALVPCGLRSRLPDLGGWPCATAYVADGTLHVDGRAFEMGRVVAVRAPRLDPRVLTRIAGTDLAAASPHAEVDGLRPPLDPGWVDRLVGAGDGLTPFGDDVLGGWLATCRAAGVPTPEVDAAVRRGRHHTTLLAATLLDCALHGEVLPQLGSYLRAVGTPGEHDAAEGLRAIGGSSGEGLLLGAELALAELSVARHEVVA